MQVKREIFFCQSKSSHRLEQGGLRPVLIVQNDIGNNYSPTTIVPLLPGSSGRNYLPMEIKKTNSPLERDSVILCEQLRTIDKKRLTEKIGSLDEETMKKVNTALRSV